MREPETFASQVTKRKLCSMGRMRSEQTGAIQVR